MNVNGKYLKDETGKVISPVTSAKTVFNSEGNSLDYTKAYFMSVLAKDTRFPINQSNKINFTAKELQKNISLSNSIFTFSEPGIYLINSQFHFVGDTTGVYRVLIEVMLTNSQGNYNDQLVNNRPFDTENEIFQSDGNINGTWILTIRQGCTLHFNFYPISRSGSNSDGIVLRGRDGSIAGTNNVFTYVYIIKLSDF